MLTPRPYQIKAIESLFTYWTHSKGNPLIVAPTASGKALIIAEFIKEACRRFPKTRIIVMSHVAKLLTQNAATLVKQWPSAPIGFNSATLKIRQFRKQILFAGIQSVHNHAKEIGHADIIIVDESHLISPNGTTMYRKFFDNMKKINPVLKVAGLTATPYRQNQGYLTQGKNALFDHIAYEIKILKLLEEGYLTTVVTPKMETQMDVSEVGTRNGDYIESQLQAAVDTDDITQGCVREIVINGEDREHWIIFCAGIEHAGHVVDEFTRVGVPVALIIGDTPDDEREQIFDDLRHKRIRGIVNVMTLTTGIDLPMIDMIALMRPTKSPVTYVQIIGRGMRLVDGNIGNLPTAQERLDAIAASKKPDCKVLDFGGVIDNLGPIDKVRVKKKPDDGEAPTKQCPKCDLVMHAAKKECDDCGYVFPPPEDIKPEITKSASTQQILSNPYEVVWIPVTKMHLSRHKGRDGKQDSIMVKYTCGMTQIKEWIFPEHFGVPRLKFVNWWQQHVTTHHLAPDTINEILDAQHTLQHPLYITTTKDGNFTKVSNRSFTEISNTQIGMNL